MALDCDVLMHVKRSTRDFIRAKRINHEIYDETLKRLLKIKNLPGTE